MESSITVLAQLPWYLKLLGLLGAATMFWKLVQGNVPKLLAALRPVALRGVDAFVLLVLAQPILRWLVIGNKDNFLAVANELLDGLEEISNAVQVRLKEDLDAASAGKPLPAAPVPSDAAPEQKAPDAPPPAA